MKLENEFVVDAPLEAVWPALTDLAGVAGCLPGAEITPLDDTADAVSGRLKVKLGPVSSEYTGTARVTERSDGDHSVIIAVEARERGGGGATGTIHSRALAAGGGTRVSVVSDIDISGKQAQLGRGLMERVAGRMLTEFAGQLEARLTAPAPSTGPAGGEPSGSPAAAPGELDLGALAVAWLARHRTAIGAVLAGAVALVLAASRRRS